MIKLVKQWQALCLFMSVLFLGLCFTSDVFGSDSRDYQIKRDDVYVKINRDGSADMTQQVHYHFKGKYHGVFIVQDTSGLGKISNILVSRDNIPLSKMVRGNGDYGFGLAENVKDLDDDEISDDLQDVVMMGDGIFYQANTNADGDEKKGDYRIITRVDPDERDQVITFQYYLGSVAKRFQDTGEINWKIIGTSWQRKLEKVNVTIDMPSAKGKQQLWVHGAKISSQTWNNHTARVKLSAKNVDTYLEIHMLFPTAAIDEAPLHHRDRYQAVMKAEQKLQRLAVFTNRDNPLSYLWSSLAFIIPFIVCLLGLLIFGHRYFRRRDRVAEKLHRFDVPSMTPIEVAAIYQDIHNDDSGNIPLATEIARLQLKGVIDVKVEDGQQTITWKSLKGQQIESPFIYFLTHHYGDENYTVRPEDIHNESGNALYHNWMIVHNKWIEMSSDKVGGKSLVDAMSFFYLPLIIFIGILWARLMVYSLGIGIVIRAIIRTIEIFLIGIFAVSLIRPLEKLQKKIFGPFNYYSSGILYSYGLGLVACTLINLIGSLFGPDGRQFGNWFGLDLAFVIQPIVVGTIIAGIVIQLLNMLIDYLFTDYDEAGYKKAVEVLQFKSMIHDMGHFAKKDLPDETLWGEYYVYATAVGETKSFIKGLKGQFGEEAVDKSLKRQLNGDYDQLASGLFVGSFTSQIIDNAEQIHTESSSDGSFSGDSGGGWGSSGGSGGDSGGGAF